MRARCVHMRITARRGGIALELARRSDPVSCSRVAFHCGPAGGLHVNVDAWARSGRHGWTENLSAAESTDARVRAAVLRFLKEVLAG